MDLIEKHKAERATILTRDQWVTSPAAPLDIKSPSDIKLAEELTDIIIEMMKKYNWAAASSENVYWTTTPSPISVIYVPLPENRQYITLLNPEIVNVGKKECPSYEGCGSIPKRRFLVPRYSYFEMRGYNLEGEETILKYGFRRFPEEIGYRETKILTNNFNAQHELDHLHGILLSDRTTIETESAEFPTTDEEFLHMIKLKSQMIQRDVSATEYSFNGKNLGLFYLIKED